MRRALGLAIFAGMLGATLLGIFLTPVFLYVIRAANDRWARCSAAGQGHAVDRQKLPRAEIDARRVELIRWLDANFQFQVSAPTARWIARLLQRLDRQMDKEEANKLIDEALNM